MTPIGHYATSASAGIGVWKLTGSPVLGAITAFLTHIPADLLSNEFWQWGNTKKAEWSAKLFFAVIMLPWAAALVLITWDVGSLLAGLFGFLGILPDIIDFISKKLFDVEIFPCHYNSPWYIPKLFGKDEFFRMQRMGETWVVEAFFTIVAIFTIAKLK